MVVSLNDTVFGVMPISFVRMLFPSFLNIYSFQDCGWKGWGEISYGGSGCVKRAQAAEFLVDNLLH